MKVEFKIRQNSQHHNYQNYQNSKEQTNNSKIRQASSQDPIHMAATLVQMNPSE